MSFTVQHKRSGDAHKRPKPTELQDGQVAINFNYTSPGLFFRLNDGGIAKAGPSIVSSSLPSAEGYTGFGIGEMWIDTSNGATLKYWGGNDWENVRFQAGTAKANVTCSDKAPLNPDAGDLWWDTVNGILMLFYSETGTPSLTDQWVQATRPLTASSGSFIFDADFVPTQDNAFNIGAPNFRVRNLYTGDLNLSNEGFSNDVDGTSGSYTIQEGEDDLFLINRRTGKKYRFMLEEVK
jgi:hypothetical protein